MVYLIKDTVNEFDYGLISALIGASVAIFSIIIKDVIIYNIRKNKDKKETIEKMYKKYSLPIVSTAESLSWRLNEIFNKRSIFLIKEKHNSDFFKYKYTSTIYRLAKMLGWLQAIENEYTYIETGDLSKNIKIRNVIKNFRDVLADGTHIEEEIAKELLELFQINKNLITKDLPIKIENIIIKYSNNGKKENINNLDENEKKKLIVEITDVITKNLGIADIPRELIDENIVKSLRIIARKESWIYRDWQDDIGNQMLINNSNKDRRYDLIDYGKFEEILDEDNNNEWIRRLENIFVDLDIENIDKYDARLIQLKDLFSATVLLCQEFWSISNIKNTEQDKTIKNLLLITKTI